jgi:hypothetical protein
MDGFAIFFASRRRCRFRFFRCFQDGATLSPVSDVLNTYYCDYAEARATHAAEDARRARLRASVYYAGSTSAAAPCCRARRCLPARRQHSLAPLFAPAIDASSRRPLFTMRDVVCCREKKTAKMQPSMPANAFCLFTLASHALLPAMPSPARRTSLACATRYATHCRPPFFCSSREERGTTAPAPDGARRKGERRERHRKIDDDCARRAAPARHAVFISYASDIDLPRFCARHDAATQSVAATLLSPPAIAERVATLIFHCCRRYAVLLLLPLSSSYFHFRFSPHFLSHY